MTVLVASPYTVVANFPVSWLGEVLQWVQKAERVLVLICRLRG